MRDLTELSEESQRNERIVGGGREHPGVLQRKWCGKGNQEKGVTNNYKKPRNGHKGETYNAERSMLLKEGRSQQKTKMGR